MSSIVWSHYRERLTNVPQFLQNEIPEYYDGDIFREATVIDLKNKEIAHKYLIRSHDDQVFRIIFNLLPSFNDYCMDEYGCYCAAPKREDQRCICEMKFVEFTLRQICHDALCRCDEEKDKFQSLFKIDFVIFANTNKLCRIETAPTIHFYERCPCFALALNRWYDGYPLLCRIQNYLSPCPESDSSDEEEEEVDVTEPPPPNSPISSAAGDSDDTLPAFEIGTGTDINDNTEADLFCYEIQN